MADQSQQQATDKSTVTATHIFDRVHTLTTTDPYEKLMCTYNPDDDSLIRNLPNPLTILTEDDQNAKDISLNPDRKTSIRIFRPPAELSVTNKLPIIIYFHGGGFILFNAASTMSHNFCQSIAANLPALVVSVDYRLAPESRLPAAYDDAVDALNWVKDQALDTSNGGEPWLKEYADFSRCFIMGCSAGGNIAYHANLRAVEMDLEPVKINGLILHIPFFGSVKRTESELRLINDLYLAPSLSDVMWELALPVGSSRDHVYCNPSIDDGESSGIKVGLIKRCLVLGFYGDPLIDRQIQLAKMLEENGVKVETCIAEGGFHGVAFHDPKTLETLLGKLKQFI